MPDQPPYTTNEIKAAARHLRRTFGDEPITLGENGWKRLIEIGLNAIAEQRAMHPPPGSPEPATTRTDTTEETS